MDQQLCFEMALLTSSFIYTAVAFQMTKKITAPHETSKKKPEVHRKSSGDKVKPQMECIHISLPLHHFPKEFNCKGNWGLQSKKLWFTEVPCNGELHEDVDVTISSTINRKYRGNQS